MEPFARHQTQVHLIISYKASVNAFHHPLPPFTFVPFSLRKSELVARKSRQRRDFRAWQCLKFNRPYTHLPKSEGGQAFITPIPPLWVVSLHDFPPILQGSSGEPHPG